ncbi:MAG: ABC transporter ATP-binding protein [FCB group bacterium]|nr:ABC transporter ATP-binding protein [FCB group bacterium]
MIKLTQITKSFGGPGAEIEVLKDLSMQVHAGDTVSILGPSGSGKSTLLNILGTLEKPTSGEFTFKGRNMLDLSEKELVHYRSRELGFVFQDHQLLPQLTLWENILLPVLALKKSAMSQNVQERAEKLLKRVDLYHRIHHRPEQLSGGEKQRIAVVRALINNPSILLADEPTGSLDAGNSTQLGDLLVDLNKEEGTAMVLVTHSTELASRFMEQYLLDDGRLKPL